MPREGALDSAFLVQTSKLVAEQADRLTSGFRSYDPDKFAAKIRGMLDEPNGVERLARKARLYSLSTDPAYFMLGPMDIQIKDHVHRKRRGQEEIATAIAPDVVNDLEADQKNESTKRVELLHEHIRDHESMNLWKFVFDGDPEKGFSRTVENLFYTSFLVRDGLAGIEIRHAQPVLFSTEPPVDQDYVDGKVSKHQCIVHIDYPKWLLLKERFGETAYFPPPPPMTDANGPIPKSATQKSNNASEELVSPNSKKRWRASPTTEEHTEEAELSQIAATPEERLPQTKRPKI